jgi:hypothetical protein
MWLVGECLRQQCEPGELVSPDDHERCRHLKNLDGRAV